MSRLRASIGAGVCAVLATLPVACAGPVHAADGTTVTLESGGRQREYVVHLPAHSSGDKLPAVLIFHGGGGSPRDMQRHTTFDQLADRDGFITVYPAGFEHSWNDGRGADTKAGAAGIDDVAFVSAVIDKLVADDHADPDRIFATGISNGGMLTEDLGCTLGGKLAAIAPVAGPLPQTDADSCAPPHPLPVLEIHGTADPIVPYTGGPVRVTSGNNGRAGSSPVLSVDATQQLWREKDGCAGDPASNALPQAGNDGTAVTVVTSEGCRDGSRVQLYSVTGGGHTWPDGNQYLPEVIVGKVTHQFDGAAVIWQFFSGFRR
jgi:polyhydroxybutyrate depolymerase